MNNHYVNVECIYYYYFGQDDDVEYFYAILTFIHLFIFLGNSSQVRSSVNMYVVTVLPAAALWSTLHFFWPPFLHHASPFLCSSSSPSRTADNTSGHSASGFWTAAPSLFFSFLQLFFSTTVFVKRCEINRRITKNTRICS